MTDESCWEFLHSSKMKLRRGLTLTSPDTVWALIDTALRRVPPPFRRAGSSEESRPENRVAVNIDVRGHQRHAHRDVPRPCAPRYPKGSPPTGARCPGGANLGVVQRRHIARCPRRCGRSISSRTVDVETSPEASHLEDIDLGPQRTHPRGLVHRGLARLQMISVSPEAVVTSTARTFRQCDVDVRVRCPELEPRVAANAALKPRTD